MRSLEIEKTLHGQRCERDFFARDTIKVAQELLGKVLVRVDNKKILAGRITETEGYVGKDDAACHASRGKTKRNEIMFREAGLAYVYLIYGMHACLNVVTEKKGFPAAVLIRALEPMIGVKEMRKNRNLDLDPSCEYKLTTGPGKLTQALQITRDLNGDDVTCSREIMIWDDDYRPIQVVSGPRIGVDYAGKDAQLPWRFGIKNSNFLSRKF